jgi:exopolysaccharide biosynthesis polyprenyl glycosylphosphotransferase
MIPILLSSVLLLLVYLVSRSVVATRGNHERVVVLGTGAGARKLAAVVEAAAPSCSVVGFVAEANGFDPTLLSLTLPRPLLGNLSELKAIVDSVQPARIIVALANPRRQPPIQALLACGTCGVAIETSAQAYERLKGKLAIESMTPSYLLFSGFFCGSIRTRPRQEAIARALSVAVALVGLVIAAPLILIIAALIKLDSPGPALFVQERVGFYGKPFRLLKFRTMRVDKKTSSEWVCDNADRITRVGRWVRKFWLDELLQFVNILRGDMNLVGPRPHPVSNYELFSRNIPYYSLRGTVRPGLTGWAQLRNGYANNLEEETEKMRYDLYYIKNRSLWFDLRIILETVKVVLFGLKVSPPPQSLRWQPVTDPAVSEPNQKLGTLRAATNLAFVAREAGSIRRSAGGREPWEPTIAQLPTVDEVPLPCATPPLFPSDDSLLVGGGTRLVEGKSLVEGERSLPPLPQFPPLRST